MGRECELTMDDDRLWKGLKVGAVLLLVLALSVSYRYTRRDRFSQKTNDAYVQQVVQEGRRLFSGYLASNVTRQPGKHSLKDFKVHSATLNAAQEWDTGIVVRVRYSILPWYDENGWSDWSAGNGTQRKDGWLVDKEAVVRLELEGGVWAMKGYGTGP